MRFLNKLIALQILFGLPAMALHAAVNVYSGASQGSSGFNPYTAFNASPNANTADVNNDSDTVSEDSAGAVSAAAAPQTTAAMPSPAKAVSPPQIAPVSRVIKYVQPQSQPPKAYTPPQITIKPVAPVQPNSAQNNANLSSASVINPTVPPAPNPDSTPQYAAVLQQIASNTAATSTSATQIATFWQSNTNLDQQWLQAVTNQTAFSALESAINTASTTQGQLASNDNLVSLQGDWSNPSASLDDSYPYLASITPVSLQNSDTDDLWMPAVNSALTDLSTEQPVVAAIGQMVNAPFDSQNGILASLQNVSTPDLLRALVIEGAVNNEIAYQELQRQQDQEVMQASMLAMLTAINNNVENGNEDVVAQEKHIVEVMYNLSEKQ